MLKKVILGVSGLVTGLLAACEEAPRSVAILSWPGGIWSSVVSATARGPLPVTVHGRPYPGATEEETFDLVGDGLKQAITKRLISVVDGKGMEKATPYRVVWVLDAPENLDPGRLCDGTSADDLVGAPNPERLHMLVAFCLGGNARAAVRGSVRRGAGADVKGAARLVSQMTRQLVEHGQSNRD
jgi:hypothetical protein